MPKYRTVCGHHAYPGRVFKCVETEFDWWTVGNEYEIDSYGYIIADDGDKYFGYHSPGTSFVPLNKPYTDWSKWAAVQGEYDDTEEYTLPGGQIVYRGRNVIKPVEETGECWAYRYMGKDTSCQFADFNINGNCKYGKYVATHLDGKLIKFTWEANE